MSLPAPPLVRDPVKPRSQSPGTKGFSRDVNNYLNGYVNTADDKARTIATLDTVALGVVIAWSRNGNAPLMHFITLALIVAGAALSAWVVFPRMPHAAKGLIFWENIRQHESPEEYYAALSQLDADDVEDLYIQQNFAVSQVLHRKLLFLRWSIIATAFAVLAAVIDFWWG